MKWLQVQALSRVNSYLDKLQLPASGIVIDGRIEAFSRKLVRSDKMLLSALKRQYSGDTGDQAQTVSDNSSPRDVSHKSAKSDIDQTATPSQAQQPPQHRSVSDGTDDTPTSSGGPSGPDTPPSLSLPTRTTSAPVQTTSLYPRGISFGRSLFGTESSAVDTSALEDDAEGSSDSPPPISKRQSRKNSRSKDDTDRRNSHSRRERSRSPIGNERSISAPPASSTLSAPGSRSGTPPPGSPFLPASPYLKAQQLSDSEASHTPIGDLHQMRTIKIFAALIECMNSSHEDHDFRYVSPMHFQHDLTIEAAQHAINSWLAPIEREYPTFSNDLWRAVDSAIGLSECEVYAFEPSDGNDNPFLDDALWAFNYFFVNRKQVMYFKCVGKRIGSSSMDDDGDGTEMA